MIKKSCEYRYEQKTINNVQMRIIFEYMSEIISCYVLIFNNKIHNTKFILIFYFIFTEFGNNFFVFFFIILPTGEDFLWQ